MADSGSTNPEPAPPAPGYRLPKGVLLLGLAALCNDASSEMIYPLLPIFLTTYIGASPLIAGTIEGLADALSSILKFVAGSWSDRKGRRKPLIVAGYALATGSRLLIASAGRWPGVLLARLVDRTGKGMRSAPRDAMIADITPLHQRGRAFGFHRSLDHTGAVIGPLVAAALLGWFHLDLRTMFLVAAVPGLIGAVMLAVWLKEQPLESAPPATEKRAVFYVPRTLRLPLVSVALFYLANSSDIFLLLRASAAGVPLALIPLLWSAHHVFKALLTVRFGTLSDRGNRKQFLVAGWLCYAAIYLVFPLARSLPAFIALFLLYGLPFILTEGAERAWISEKAEAAGQGRSFGVYYLVNGFCALAGTVLFGWLYQSVSPEAAFATGAALAAAAALSVLMQGGGQGSGG